MNKHKGFTLTELIIVVSMLGILAMCFADGIGHKTDPSQNERCVAGHLFVQQPDGSVTQVIGTEGGGVSCR